MNNEDDDNEAEETSQSPEMKRHRSRLSSKRTRENLIHALESERIRLYLANTALKYHSGHLREAIQAIKNQLPNHSSSTAISISSDQGSTCSENSYPTRVPRNVQFGPVGGNGPQQVLPNNLSATLPQQQIPQMAPPLTADLNQIAQGHPLLAGTALNAGMLQSIQQQQTPFQTALQAEMNRRLLPAPLTFPIAQVQPQPPVNLAAAAAAANAAAALTQWHAAAAALTQWQQLPPGVTPRTRIRDDKDRSKDK